MSVNVKSMLAKGAFVGLIMMCGASVAVAEGWGKDGGDKHDKKEWSGGGGSGAWGFGEGHMTARLRAVWNLKLTDDQKSKIRAIQHELRAKHWELEDKIELEADKLMGLYRKVPRDPKAIGKVYGKMFDYRRQQIEAGIEAGNKVFGNLTSSQLKEVWQYMPKSGGMGYGNAWSGKHMH